MAAAIEIQRMLDNGAEFIPKGTQVTNNTEKFDDVLGKEIAVQNTTQSFTKLTDDSEAQKLAEEIMQYILTGEGDIDSIKDKFTGYSDNMTRVEILSILQQIMSYACNENNGLCPSGKTQDYLNRLFFADNADSITPSPLGTSDITLENLQELLKSKEKDGKKVDSSDALAELMASMTPAITESQDGLDIMGYQKNNVSIVKDASVYSLSFKELSTRIMDVVEKLVDVPKEQIFKGYFGTGNTITEASVGFNPQSNNILNGVEIIANNAQGNMVSDKALAENQLTKASMLSKVTDTKGMDELASILSDPFTLSRSDTPIEENQSNFDEIFARYDVDHQITDKIFETVDFTPKQSEKSFTMKLNPENLGEIIVKVTKVDDKVTVTLGAESGMTQKLLGEKASELVATIYQKDPDIKVVEVNSSPSAYLEYLSQGSGDSANGNQNYYRAQNFGRQQESNEEVQVNNNEGRLNRLWQMA